MPVTLWNMSMRLRHILLLIALAMLGVRALTPLGYMPASAGSGLLYELCPDGMPAEITHALSGGGDHHHHHDDQVGASESCPIGHMLASEVAAEIDSPIVVAPEPLVFFAPSSAIGGQPTHSYQRCRSPPA